MKPVSPVFDDLTELEVVLGKGQPEYTELPVIVGLGRVTCRMEPDEEERKAIANGADIIVTALNFQKPIQPLAFMVSTKGTIMGNKEIREHIGIFSTKSLADTLEQIMKQLGGTAQFDAPVKTAQLIRWSRALEARCGDLQKTVFAMEAMENTIKGKMAGIMAYALKEAARYMEYTGDAEMLNKLAEAYVTGEKVAPDDVSESL